MSKWKPTTVKTTAIELKHAEYKMLLEEIAELILNWQRQKQTVSTALDTPKQKEIEP